MRHHAQKPTIKQLLPVRIRTRNQSCQCTDTVFPVPTADIIKIFFYRIVERNIFRIQKTVYITIPGIDPFFQGTDRDTVAHTFVHGLKVKVDGITLAVFQIIQHGVKTKFITTVHKFFQQKSRLLLPSDTVFLTKTLTFLIKIMNRRAYDSLILFPIVMNECLPDRFFFGDTRFETMLGKVYKQRLQIISTLPVFHFLKCPVQRRFINLREGFCRLISRLQAQQEILLTLFTLPESFFTGHSERLFQTERHCIGIVIRRFVQCHAAFLRQHRCLQINIVRKHRLVALYRQPVGMSMK